MEKLVKRLNFCVFVTANFAADIVNNNLTNTFLYFHADGNQINEISSWRIIRITIEIFRPAFWSMYSHRYGFTSSCNASVDIAKALVRNTSFLWMAR